MSVKIILFKVVPVFAYINDETNLVYNVGNGKEFTFYPDKPFNIKKTEEDLCCLLENEKPKI